MGNPEENDVGLSKMSGGSILGTIPAVSKIISLRFSVEILKTLAGRVPRGIFKAVHAWMNFCLDEFLKTKSLEKLQQKFLEEAQQQFLEEIPEKPLDKSLEKFV